MYWKIGLHMIERSTIGGLLSFRGVDGLLFFRGGRGVHKCIARNLTSVGARMYCDEIGLLPIDFFVTFDNFRTLGTCRLMWRYHAHFATAFEQWVDIRDDAARSEIQRARLLLPEAVPFPHPR